jgi:hypothetical protein
MMKRILMAVLMAFTLVCLVEAQRSEITPDPAPIYAAVSLQHTLEVIAQAKREIYLIVPTLRNRAVHQSIRSRLANGVILRLLIANKQGYSGLEKELAHARNVDARWLPESFGSSILVVDDSVMIVSPIISGVSSGVSSTVQSVEITRPELVAASSAGLKQVFAQARRIK